MAYPPESGRLFEPNLVDWLILLGGVALTGILALFLTH
jgi:hypothetical protein